ncbi:MAG: hypothetical protein Kow00103_08500 [Candidatus Caldatribacteriota bacterium]
MGEKLARDFEKKHSLVEDIELNFRVNEIGKKLASNSDLKGMNYHFKIVDLKGVNAFSFPGGYIYVTKDLLDYVQSDDELAGVLAHEIAHIIHNHALNQIINNTKYNLLTILAVLLTGESDVALLGRLTTITFLNQYSRENEEEADLTAIELLIKNGYNPVGFLTCLERLSSREILRPEINWGIFQTHPKIEDRIVYIRDLLIKKGIKIDRRAAANYLKIETKFMVKDFQWIGMINLDGTTVFNFPFSGEIKVFHKILSIAENLDRFLSLDLNIYELRISVNDSSSTLFIGSNPIITLTDSEAVFLHKTSQEVISEMKESIKQVLWSWRLRLLL